MAIELAFSFNREIFRITIENKNIWYSDRKWTKQVRLIPRDEEFIKKVTFSRNKIPGSISELFILTKKEQEEYDSAKSDEELKKICIQDATRKGAILIKGG